jgi:uncharacterized protein (DUF1800 family)
VAFVWNAANAAHLHRRAGFGASGQQIQQDLKKGFEKTLAGLLEPDKPMAKPGKKTLNDLTRLQAWWLGRMVKGQHPLHDRLTLFWHNHFATAQSKVQDLHAMHRHVATLHDLAFGDFRLLLDAVARDPAMLVWLDNWENVADDINENFGRELMELFTTGTHDFTETPNYTEDDVIAVARSFTGWGLRSGEFDFDPSEHDDGPKTFKGATANYDGGDIMDLLCADPATARRLAKKLWSHFAFPIELSDPIADELADVYLQSGRSIAAMVEWIFRNDAFWSDEAKRALVKGPAEWFTSALRLLGAKPRKDHPWEIGGSVTDMGQALFNPPSVFGWDEGLGWVATSGVMERATTAEWIADARDKYAPVRFKPDKLMPKKKDWAALDAAAVVQLALSVLDLPDADAGTIAQLQAYAAADENGDPQAVVVDEDFVDLKLRGLFALVLSSPEWQLA